MIKIANKRIIQLFILILLFKIINGYTFNYINHRFFKLENAVFDTFSEKELFLLVVIFAPVIETLIFQLFLYQLLDKIKVNSVSIVILMSIAFSIAHWYHWLYVIAAFINGLFLNYFYAYILKNRNELIAVLLTIVLHSSYNLFGFLFVE